MDVDSGAPTSTSTSMAAAASSHRRRRREHKQRRNEKPREKTPPDHQKKPTRPQPGEFDFLAKLREARAVSDFMLERNEARIARVQSLIAVRKLPVITFSHFVPRQDLNPPVDRLRFRELTAVSVCDGLDKQLRSIGSVCHVFAHTHIRTDVRIDGVRYVQFPLGYPGEGSYCPRFADVAPLELVL